MKNTDALQALSASRRMRSTFVSFMSFMEVCYISLQERDESEAQERLRLMKALPVLRVESTEALGMVASQFKASYRISVSDAWIAALAKDRDAILVIKILNLNR